MSVGLSRIFVLTLALAALMLAVTSFRYTLSEYHSYQGKRYEKHWEKRGSISSTEQWQRARWWMQRALFLNDQNPDTNLRMARILEWYSFTPEPDGALIRSNLEAAAEAIDHAITLRPQQGFGYSSRALLKARRWQVDESLSEDIARAMELAPWERVGQLQLMHAGLLAWPALNEAGRQLMIGKLVAMAEYRPDMAATMFDISAEYGNQITLCNRLAELDLVATNFLENRECQTGE
jgi:hypothetical protein